MPVRSDTDHLAVTIETLRLRGRRQIPIVELSAGVPAPRGFAERRSGARRDARWALDLGLPPAGLVNATARGVS